MRGKFVNISISLLNILLGVLIFFFGLYIPQSLSNITLQENMVRTYISYGIYALIGIVFLINIIEYFIHKKDGDGTGGYWFVIFTFAFIFYNSPFIGLIPILAGIIIFNHSIRSNLVESSSTNAISIVLMIAVFAGVLFAATFFYKTIGAYITKKENEGEIAYKEDYFKYIKELDLEEPYINVKAENKYGYITPTGQIAIDFKYDYASPFAKIKAFDKEFEVALVEEDGICKIILKNERVVLTYKSESAVDNYSAKSKELQDIYYNTLKQSGDLSFEIDHITDKMNKVKVYENDDTKDKNYTYRYNYNNDWDILVTTSTLGGEDKYELINKKDSTYRFQLNARFLDYDDKYVYLFSDGTIPYYEPGKQEQGWFTTVGKKITLQGNAQILDIFDDRILLKDYSRKYIYFLDKSNTSNRLSEYYKSIYLVSDRYIVKDMNNKYQVINTNFERVFDEDYDMVDPYLVYYGLYIVGNTSDDITFNEYNYPNNLNLKLLNNDGEVMLEGIQQIYANYYQISDEKNKNYSTRYSDFINKLKSMEFHFVGDKFYQYFDMSD